MTKIDLDVVRHNTTYNYDIFTSVIIISSGLRGTFEVSKTRAHYESTYLQIGHVKACINEWTEPPKDDVAPLSVSESDSIDNIDVLIGPWTHDTFASLFSCRIPQNPVPDNGYVSVALWCRFDVVLHLRGWNKIPSSGEGDCIGGFSEVARVYLY